MLDRLVGNLRFAIGLASFLRRTTSPEAAFVAIRGQMPRREASFLDLAERAIYKNPRSPYLRLLHHAGIELSQLKRMVSESGLDSTMEQLYALGVYVSYEEMKGREPIRRGDLEFTAKVSDFDNPLLSAFFASHTSGSRSQGTRVFIDLAMLDEESSHMACLFAAHRVIGLPLAVWRPIPPSSVGMNALLRYTRIGMRPEVWFSQDKFRLSAGGWRGVVFLTYTIAVSYLAGRPLPWPRFLPIDRAVVAAGWLATKKRLGTPAILDSSMSGAIRVCLAAKEHGLDISGSTLRVGGEPLTPAKAMIVKSAGAHVIDRYSMMETGTIAHGCADPIAPDDMHVLKEKLLITQREKVVDASGSTVPALAFTTLMPSCQMVMLNAESGDYGDLDERECSCSLGALGYSTHVSGVRGYDKLTSEGITFMGSELYRLVDETLPARFGGHATDYQLLEEEDDGIPKVSIVVSEKLGEIDEEAVIATVLTALKGYYTVGHLMSDQWRNSRTLRVLRREPYASGSRKILPLHILNKSGRQ
jgi:hypothetical protein